jgi:hypothetical protein
LTSMEQRKRTDMIDSYLLSKERRASVRHSTRLAYLSTSERFVAPHLNKPEILRISVGETRHILIQGKAFKSVIGGIFLALAMKMVERLIEKWLDENLFSVETVPPQFTKGEPGYVEK